MDRNDEFYDELVTNREKLFERFDKRINKLTEEEIERNRIAQLRRLHTEKVAIAILKLVSKILNGADTKTGSIEEDLDPIFGTLGKSTADANNTGYYFNDEGLNINFNYTSAEMWGNSRDVYNFAQDVDWDYLVDILKGYNIEIVRERETRNVSDGGRPVYVDYDSVIVKVKNNTKTK